MSLNNDSMPAVRYRDMGFRIIACLFAAHFIVMFGVKKTFFEVLVKGYYHIPMASSFLIAFLLFTLVRFICIQLDKRYDWRLHALYRIPLQLLFGLLMPGLLAFLLAGVYFWVRGVNIMNTLYLRIDYPVILLLILVLNIYYLVYYVIARLKQSEDMVPSPLVVQVEGTPQQQAFLVNRGTRSIPIPVEEIAYFYRSSQNYLRTMSGDDYYITQSLDEVETRLPTADFFRVNRQMLVSRKACQQILSLEYYKLELITAPPYKEQVVVSQKKNREFKMWMKGL